MNGNRTLNRLSARFVATAMKPGRYADGGNLYLSISPDGRRRWVLLYTWQGRAREMGLGSARDVTLGRARERATEARQHLSDRVDPMTTRKAAERRIPTFGEVADEHIASMSPSW